MLARLMEWWNARNRAFDERVLFPAIVREAMAHGRPEAARAMLYMHMQIDPAWRDMTEDDHHAAADAFLGEDTRRV